MSAAAALFLRAGTVAAPGGLLSPGWVALGGGLVAGVGEGSGDEGRGGARVVDLGERIVAPGYVDIHVHGGDGAQVNGEDFEEVADAAERMARFHARHGTTSLLATTVSDSPQHLLTSVAALAEVAKRGVAGGAALRGIHLEGPWIARAKLGAHDPFALRPPDASELRTLAEAAAGMIRMVTVAPELPHCRELMAAAMALGIEVAIGHTEADYDTTRAAIEAGARHATHLFNAMAPPHHRRPGAVTALLLDDRVTLEVIADLAHVHPAMLALAARCAPGRLVAVSDAAPAAGLGEGSYRFGGAEVSVEAGRVTLRSDPSTLAGSVLTMDVAVRNLVSAVGLPLEAALRAASSTPARAAGCGASGLGCLLQGAPADLVVLEPDLSVAATMVGGEPVFDPSGCLGDLAGSGAGPA